MYKIVIILVYVAVSAGNTVLSNPPDIALIVYVHKYLIIQTIAIF